MVLGCPRRHFLEAVQSHEGECSKYSLTYGRTPRRENCSGQRSCHDGSVNWSTNVISLSQVSSSCPERGGFLEKLLQLWFRQATGSSTSFHSTRSFRSLDIRNKHWCLFAEKKNDAVNVSAETIQEKYSSKCLVESEKLKHQRLWVEPFRNNRCTRCMCMRLVGQSPPHFLNILF